MDSEYYTVPALTGDKPNHEKPIVFENFIIGRRGYGEIQFDGKTNLQDVDLQALVHINNGNVVVYPDDASKPPVGFGLNKPALVTLHQIKKKRHSATRDFKSYLRLVTDRMGAEFIGYIEDTGSWTFRVSHFSKYGLNDSDEEAEAEMNNRNATQNPSQNLEAGKVSLKAQSLRVDLLGRPRPLDGEETVPKSLFFDPMYTEDMNGYNQFVDPPLHLDDYNNLSKTTMSPSQSIMKYTVNNERLFGLKASLFEDEPMEEDRNLEPELILASQEVKRLKDGPASYTPLSLPFLDRSVDLPLIQSALVDSPVYPTPRKSESTQQLLEVTPYERSLLFQKHNLPLDMGCFKGLSFRVGWSPQMFFLHKPSTSDPSRETLPMKVGLKPFSTIIKSLPLSSSLSSLHASTLDMSSFSSSVFCDKQNILENMQKQLEHKAFTLEDGVPYFFAQPGVQLLNSHYRLSLEQAGQSKRLEDVFTVWSLCSALWGECQEDDDPNVYNYHLQRKELFSHWLMSTTAADMNKEVDSSKLHLDAIFSLLSGYCIADACTKALEFNDLRLGLLLSQADSFLPFRCGLLRQLENWFQFEVDNFIEARRLKIYALLAGRVVWKLNGGSVVNCCEDLDWKRALALHLWYHCQSTASIQDALIAYEHSFKGTGPNGRYAPNPYPPYIERDNELHVLASESESSPLDMSYYLLKLYCDRSTPLGKMLVPLTYGPSQLDYSLSWMVHEVLLALEYRHLPVAQAQLLNIRFASQLESLGLWDWAVFVLLHVNGPARRKHLVMEVLMRHVTLTQSDEQQETEDFLTEKLHVPNSWLFEAKAVLARSSGRYKEEAWCLLKSGQWTMSHQIIIKKIAPDCIIHEQFEYLKGLLMELSSPEVSSSIKGWPTGGEVYLDYIHVSEKIEQMLSGQLGAYEIEELHPMLISLSNRICSLQCQSAKDRLCQSEMSKKTVILLRALLTIRKDVMSGTPVVGSNRLLASFLPNLPMPEDYALQELRATFRSYMLEVTSGDRH